MQNEVHEIWFQYIYTKEALEKNGLTYCKKLEDFVFREERVYQFNAFFTEIDIEIYEIDIKIDKFKVSSEGELNQAKHRLYFLTRIYLKNILITGICFWMIYISLLLVSGCFYISSFNLFF